MPITQTDLAALAAAAQAAAGLLPVSPIPNQVQGAATTTGGLNPWAAGW